MAVTATLRKSGPAAAPAPTIDVDVQKVSAPEPTADGTSIDEIAGVGSESTPKSTSTAVATTQPSAVATRNSDISGGALQGEFDETDLRHPTLMIVNGSGVLSQSWPQGTLLFGEDQLLPAPDLRNPRAGDTFRFIPLMVQKGFRENLTDEQRKAGLTPRKASTIAEVEQLGGTLRWDGDIKPTWGPTARCVLLIEKPADYDHPNFVIELNGKLYALGVAYTGGGSYRAFAQVIYNAALTSLLIDDRDAEGNVIKTERGLPKKVSYLPKKFWTYRVKKSPPSKNGFTSFVPEIRLTTEDTSPEIREFIKGVMAAEGSASGE